MGHIKLFSLYLILYGFSLISAQSANLKDDEVGLRSEGIVTDKNAKPRFERCDTYKPMVKEEQPAGTMVETVHAEDSDPVDSGGTVTYEIVKSPGERNYFAIDNRTGSITTVLPFDRDEPSRQKEIYLTVQATDNGRPPLADICTIKVTVTDINDNVPSFDQQRYTVQVAEDSVSNHEIVSVFAYDIDDGENSKLTYSFKQQSAEFNSYFRIDDKTGVVYLTQDLKTRPTGMDEFNGEIQVYDNGNPPFSATAEIRINVVSSDKQPPKIISVTPARLDLKENFHDFNEVLFTIEAESGISDNSLAFELIKGKTAQTNKEDTFQLTPSKDDLTKAFIKLIRALDYETVIEYTLTVRVTNKERMDASITIPVYIEDVNDETPSFIDTIKGSVVENDSPGVQAMQVRAIDKDGTTANNIVSYELESHQNLFSIDKNTGYIKSLVKFDREQEALYHVRVKAYDNSPSALKPNSDEPNTAIQTFQISIEDRNDNKPQFTKSVYYIFNVSESTDVKKDVGEVKALDNDTASQIVYSIESGNVDDVFMIETTTGRIKVNKQLDFEKMEKYELTVKAFDGIYSDTARVIIEIQNENDEPPQFVTIERNWKLKEEELTSGCIVTVNAYDPDIKDRSLDQHIKYYQQTDFLDVDSSGCVRLVKKLDRDPPLGVPTRQVYIWAHDNDGIPPNSLKNYIELKIVLEDINDNAPYFNVTEFVWYENQGPGTIGKLSADDYDTPENGPPFTYEIDETAGEDITSKFAIGDGDSLQALVTFDREQKKFYDIPFKITDSGVPRQSGISMLRVVIGDMNDNQATYGESEIFVYTHEHIRDTIQIGRVYVDDLDDWDINDKTFVQKTNSEFFRTDKNGGYIHMDPSIVEGEYVLSFEVEERSDAFDTHMVNATVRVTVKDIPEEAIRKSGSVRMMGSTIEEFVEKSASGESKKDVLQKQLSVMLNTSAENVDVITVIPSPTNNSLIDVRFSAHGSPYYEKERLNNKITEYQDKLEHLLSVEFVMININECFNESICELGYSCSNYLHTYEEPAVVYTNKTSFVGVKAIAERKCDCSSAYETIRECFNGGTKLENAVCNCAPGYEGPHCELTSIGFYEEESWAMYPTFSACNRTDITLTITPHRDNGLVFYVGPLTVRHAKQYRDFMSLELNNGYLVLKMNLGGPTTTQIISDNKKIEGGTSHNIRISYGTDSVEMEVDDCKSQCLKITNFEQNGLLNVNGPLQLGRMKYAFVEEETKNIWDIGPPINKNFIGCIRNFTINDFLYNLGQPSDQYKAVPGCSPNGVIAAVTFGIDSNFLVAILVCIALLLILLLAVVVHRRKHDNYHEKDIDDTRANIINYEDEGGGECDTNYDLSVFRSNLSEKPILQDNNDVNADISGFLDNKKDNCDKNPDNLPYDDVRHYAYEGDGNSTGSLSSLASCTDEGDLKFNYLSSFGPRFRKLADMYGEDPSDEDSPDGGEESWC